MYIVFFYVKYPLFLSDFNDLNFLDGFFKNVQMSNFIKIHPVGAELFHADGWTDRHDKARSHFFCDLANVPNNEDLICTTSAA